MRSKVTSALAVGLLFGAALVLGGGVGAVSASAASAAPAASSSECKKQDGGKSREDSDPCKPKCKKDDDDKKKYPPGKCKPKGTVSDRTPHPGETITATSGDGLFNPGTTVIVPSKGKEICKTTATDKGGATCTFVVPTDTGFGAAKIVFSGTLDGSSSGSAIPIDVVNAVNVASSSASGSGLLRSGPSLLVPLTAIGLGLALVGGVAVARRRRDDGTNVV